MRQHLSWEYDPCNPVNVLACMNILHTSSTGTPEAPTRVLMEGYLGPEAWPTLKEFMRHIGDGGNPHWPQPDNARMAMLNGDAADELAASANTDIFGDTRDDPETLKAKARLLKEYAGKPVRSFRQFDCFVNVEPGDPMVRPDSEDHCVFSGFTDELRRSGAGIIRVQAHIDDKREDVVAALRKIADRIDNGFWNNDPSSRTNPSITVYPGTRADGNTVPPQFTVGNLVLHDRGDGSVERGMVTEDDGDGSCITVIYENGSMDRYDAGPDGGLNALSRIPNYDTEQDLF